jgi:hypothetical protein
MHRLTGNDLATLESLLKALPNMRGEQWQTPFNNTLGEVTIFYNDYRKERASPFKADPTPVPSLVTVDRTISSNADAEAVVSWENVLPGSIVRLKVLYINGSNSSARWPPTSPKISRDQGGCSMQATEASPSCSPPSVI